MTENSEMTKGKSKNDTDKIEKEILKSSTVKTSKPINSVQSTNSGSKATGPFKVSKPQTKVAKK